MRARAGDLPGMRLRLPYAIGLALLAGFFAVLFDRVALRYLEVDGAAPAVVVVPAAAPPPLEPSFMPSFVPDLFRSPSLHEDGEGCDAWAQALFEDAVMRLREHDTIKACAQLETLGRGVPEGSPWRDKAAILRQHRCAD